MSDNDHPAREELNEARLTAYALGQLDAAECSVVEAELAGSPESRQLVDEVRALSGHVQEAARREPLPPPSPGLRDRVNAHLDEAEYIDTTAEDIRPTFVRQPRPKKRTWIPWVAAACMLLIVAGSVALAIPGAFRGPGGIAGVVVPRSDSARDSSRRNYAAYEEAAELEWLSDSPADLQEAGAGPSSDVMSGLAYDPAPPSIDLPIDAPDAVAIKDEVLIQPFEEFGRRPAQVEYLPERQQGPRGGSPPQPSGQPPVDEEDIVRLRACLVPDRPPSDAETTGAQAGDDATAPATAREIESLAQQVASAQRTREALEERRNALSQELAMRKEVMQRHGVSPQTQGRDLPDTAAPGTEQYDQIFENELLAVTEKPLSTFSIDVDTASYANVRRFLNDGRLPPRNAVRIEELVNYFQYRYPPPEGETPFSAHMELAQCPWQGDHLLLKVGLKGREIQRGQRGLSNLVFLLDVSGSMSSDDKLPLVKQAMRLLVQQLSENDRVAIVTYASSAGVRLESTCGENQDKILRAIDGLNAGGSTHGSAGIQLAYEQAAQHFIREGVNRVILCTDGDLNVGITRDDDLVRFIEEKAQTGVFLTVLGFGTGNLKDAKMEKLADKGNGAYAYIDNLREARKVLVEQMTGSLMTIAKDVKIQIEFNPAEVAGYRLIGYENRVMAARDFDDDRKDAGEIGAGHTVTALYELVPAGFARSATGDQPLKYQRVPDRNLTDAARSGELLTLRLRYKEPDGQQSQLLEFVLDDDQKRFGEASPDFQFAAAVAAFGMVLRGSQYAGDATLAAVEEYAVSGLGDDPQGYRAEFVDLVRRARQLAPR